MKLGFPCATEPIKGFKELGFKQSNHGLWPPPSPRNPTLVALSAVRETLSAVHAEIFRKLDDVTRRVTSVPMPWVFSQPNFAKIDLL